jgi:hypothetical protein
MQHFYYADCQLACQVIVIAFSVVMIQYDMNESLHFSKLLTSVSHTNFRWYLLIRPKTKKNFRKASIETATGNFLGCTVITLEHSQSNRGRMNCNS